jgi:glutathione S-transferase
MNTGHSPQEGTNNMKLYISPGACSLSPHIVSREAGLNVEIVKVDLRAKTIKATGADYRAINSKGAVPALQLDDGQVLTEGAAIVQYLADQKPASNLAPAAGTLDRYRLQEWLSYIGAEIHKLIGGMFNPAMTEEAKAATLALTDTRLQWVAKQLEGKDYLMGKTFTVADAYLFTVVGWLKYFKVDLGQWPAVKAHSERVAARPAVQAALAAEAA